MHILIVARGIPSARSPLLGVFEWDQAKALVEADVKVDFFAVDLRSLRQFRPWGIRHGEKDGVRWHSISIPVGAIPFSCLCWIGTTALQKLYRNVFGDNGHVPDVIHAHFTGIGYMASELATKEKIPLVITEHSSMMVQPTISDSLKRIAEKGYRAANRVIAVSTFLKDCICRHTGVVAKVVPNIVPLEFHYGKHEHYGMRFISVANLIPGKRINILLRAFAEMSSSYEDVVLDIVGDGDQRGDLEILAKELNISDKVNFHGALLRQEIDTLYRDCDCFVLPSAFETFGVVYVEAMAAGLPVIATRCGGPEDFITEENGILVDVDDIEALEQAMLFMYQSRKQFDSMAISQNAMNRFSSKMIAKALVSVYNDVLINRKITE